MVGGIVSVVRLQSLDNCLRSSTQIPDFFLAAPTEALRISKNRERGFDRLRIRQCPGIGNRQLVGQMVEARTEVLKTIAECRCCSARSNFDSKLNFAMIKPCRKDKELEQKTSTVMKSPY